MRISVEDFLGLGEVEDSSVQEKIGFLVASFFPRSLSQEAGSIDGIDLLISFLENRALDLGGKEERIRRRIRSCREF